MTTQVSKWIENCLSAESLLSHFQGWVNTEDGWRHYFTLLTTYSLPETEIRDQDNDFHVICKSRSIGNVREYLPPEKTSQTTLEQITESALGDAEYLMAAR